MIKYILNLFSSNRLADSDDRNAVIECSSRALTFDKTISGYQEVCNEGVESVVLFSDSTDFAEVDSVFIALNSLSNLVKSRLGVIRFLASGEMGDLDRIQIMQLFDEIDNQVEKIEHDVNQHIRQPKSLCQKKQESNRMYRTRVSDAYDDFEEVS